MNVAAKALWIIETRLAAPPSLEDLAQATDTSPYGLLRAFSAQYGMPPIAYARLRRLSEAAKRIAAGAPSLLDVALEAGYESHEAFTRAFKAAFGAAPADVRANPAARTAPLVAPESLQTGAAHALDGPRLETEPARPLVALTRRYRGDEAAAIPSQWAAFGSALGPAVKPGAAQVTYGVLSAGEGAEADYACAVSAEAVDRLPHGFTHMTLPGGRYAVFACAAHVSAVRDAWVAAWTSPALHAAGAPIPAPEFERYGPAFDPRSGAGGFELWIPVAPR